MRETVASWMSASLVSNRRAYAIGILPEGGIECRSRSLCEGNRLSSYRMEQGEFNSHSSSVRSLGYCLREEASTT
jgi:hypothetical protein